MSTPASFAQRQQLAHETRKRFVQDAGQVMLAVAEAVQEQLGRLMSEAAPAREMQHRRDAWTAYLSRQTAWQEATITAWQAALKPSLIKPKTGLEDSFELLGAEVMDNKILASRFAQRLMEPVGAELNDLLLRLKYLMGTQEQSGPDILQPEVLVLAMIEQWALVGMPLASWPLVSDLVLKFLMERLLQAYQNANALLIRQKVLPTIELKHRVSRAPAASPRGGAAAAPVTRQNAAGQEDALTPGAAMGESPTGQMMPRSDAGAFGGRLGWDQDAEAGGRASSGFGGAAEETRMMTSRTPLTRARSRAQGVLGQLKRLLMGSGAADFEATHHQPPTPALAAAIAVRPEPASTYAGRGTDSIADDYSSSGVAQVASELRQRSAELKNKAATKNEKATIEIVALMFQAILQEERIPPGIRVWFARLQMPVLRVALAEPDFFGTLNHPARQLIDRMGSCVMGFDASGINGGALETEIKRVVQVIEQYPETGKRVYQLVYVEFQKFLAQFLCGQGATQKLVSVAQQVEEKETLTIQYTIEMRNMLKDMPVREEIREFLFKVWAEVLAVAGVRKGPQHVETLGFKKVATDLVWAASAKPNRSDRARVIQDLPLLLQKLRAGMSLLGLAPSVQEAHLKLVNDTLADAFLSKTQAIPPEQIAAMAARLANLEDFVSDDGMGELPLDAQSIEMMLGLEAASIDVVTNGGSKPGAAMLAWAQELQLGSWLTLDHNAQVSQVQFVWRSERRHLNLLATSAGHSYLIQTGRLAAYLQAGLLLPQEEDTLTVRATRDALGKLEANPERLLG
jgi:hypothetical protein